MHQPLRTGSGQSPGVGTSNFPGGLLEFLSPLRVPDTLPSAKDKTCLS